MGKKKHKHMALTDAQFVAEILDLRNTWSDESKSETNDTKLKEACERFIVGMENALDEVGGHPPPPPPRIRP